MLPSWPAERSVQSPPQGTHLEAGVEQSLSSAKPCSIENRTFQGGEKLVYRIYYKIGFVWVPAALVHFEVNDEGDQYFIQADGKTLSSYEWFYKVHDHYETRLSKETLLPNSCLRDIHEGKYHLYDEVVFDQPNQVANSLRGKTKEKAKWTKYSVDPCMHDLLSIIYFTRNRSFDSLEPEETFPVSIFMDKKVWPLKVKYKGRKERKKIKGNGRWDVLQFSPEVIAGTVFEEGTEMNVWVSDDKNRVPVLIESPLSVGSVKVVLKEYENLLYETEARVK